MGKTVFANAMNAKLVLLAIALCASGSYALSCGGSACSASNCLVTETTPSGGQPITITICDTNDGTCGTVGSGNCASQTANGNDIRVLCKSSDTASNYNIPS